MGGFKGNRTKTHYVYVPFCYLRLTKTFHFCRACRSAAVKFSPEIVHESCHGKCREISGEISLLLVPQETKLENAQNFSRQISCRFSRDVLQLQMPNFMAFFILQTFVLETFNDSSGFAVLLPIPQKIVGEFCQAFCRQSTQRPLAYQITMAIVTLRIFKGYF